MKELILGGVRSGKSRLADQRARESGLEVTFIATSVPGDDEEMQRRIAAHRANRPAEWQVVEEPVELAGALATCAAGNRCVVVECLTVWIANLLFCNRPGALEQERNALMQVFPTLPGHVIFVSNETNLGVHPMGELSRRFCDEAGTTHQILAAECERVTFTVAGISWTLKGRPG